MFNPKYKADISKESSKINYMAFPHGYQKTSENTIILQTPVSLLFFMFFFYTTLPETNGKKTR